MSEPPHLQPVFVHIEQSSPRARYIIGHVLERMLGWSVEWVDDQETLRATDGLRLLYGTAELSDVFRVHPEGLLHETHLRSVDPQVTRVPGQHALFPTATGDTAFDVFAAAFWMLSRMEEHAIDATDEHGRVRTNDLFAARHGFLDVPVVDEWALWFARSWRERDERVPLPNRKYSHVFTMDVDNGFAYLGRSWWRVAGAHARAMLENRTGEMKARRDVLSGKSPDPFDVYGETGRWTEGLADRRIVFWLISERGEHDHAVPTAFPLLAQRIKETSHWAEIGIHPSYDSLTDPALIEQQRIQLAAVREAPVDLSRQHFLRIHKGAPYPHLQRLGFREDHSMGLHDELGFRAGTCTPFTWYDLKNDQPTDLEIWPHTVMDNTLRNKLKLTPAEGVQAAKWIVDKVRAVQGTFIGLWHESFLSDHLEAKGWRDAIKEITQYAKP
ncbi:MAG: hypothetical protein IPG74_11980 [Flavobacteriales bacterium]|nr:hypothetical protein [Flavobacteriales bacterium]